MTDIVYVIGADPYSNENLPLRYSLRSLDKHGKNIGNIYVVGYIPSWLNQNTTKTLFVQDETFCKHWNIINCIKRAIEAFGLTQPFLYSSDDHFLLRDADMDKWPRYEKGILYTKQEYISMYGKELGKYQLSIANTRSLFDAEGITPTMACCHMNTWINPSALTRAMELKDKYFNDAPFGFEPTCLFTAASILNGEKIEFTHIDSDVKLSTLAEIENFVSLRRQAFSLKQNLERDQHIIRWMKKNYPEKSQWEK